MRFFITLLWMLSLPVILCAQDILKVKHYGVDQGLPQSSVWDIIQDNYGFLWVSTADGLCRFDGYQFNSYRHNENDSLSISGNSFHLMALGKEGDIWLTSDQGFDKYNSKTGKFLNLYKYDQLKASVYNKTIGEDKSGFVWVWIMGEGLMKFNKVNNQLGGKYCFSGKDDWRNNQAAYEALFDSDGNIWMTYVNPSSLIFFNIKTETFHVIDARMAVRSIALVNSSVLLIGVAEGLLRYDIETKTFEKILFGKALSQTSQLSYAATKILKVNDDEFWVGTYHGIFVYSESKRAFIKRYTSFSGSKENFMVVHTLFKDRSGNIWIGTNGDGLKKYLPSSNPWMHYKSSLDRGDIVKSVYADGEDHVFVGYFQNGLDVFSKSKGFIKKIKQARAPLNFPSDWIYGLQGIDGSKVFIMFSSFQHAFGVYDYKVETFQNVTKEIVQLISPENHTANNFPVSELLGDGSIIFNCRGALIQGNFKNSNKPEFILLKEFQGEIINSIFIDSKETIWVGTMNGYFTLPKSSIENSKLSFEWMKGNPKINKQIKTIAEDAEGKIWMGTTSGLYMLNKNGTLENTLTMGAPLINDFVYGILKDNRGDMWFSHNKGLTRYHHQTKTFKNFSVDDGLQANEFNTGAYYKSTSGELFFGGINGTNSFFPEDIKDNHQIPSVQITRVDLNDKPYLSDTVYWAQKKLTLAYTKNTLGFEFAGLEFTDPGKNQYAWRMSNIDKDWVFSGNKRFTRYANIPPGEYRFEVKASNNDGVWNETPRVLQIEIIPPFWQTWWFKMAMITVALGITAVIATLISRQRYRRKLMALEVQQKIQDDRDRISRELHDMVGSQLSLISSNLDWVAHPVAPLSDTERNKRLEEVSNMSKDVINNLRETIWALKKQEISFSDFTDKLKVIAHQQIDVTPATRLEFNDEGTDELILGAEEALHLLRICQEAIHNSVKHAHMSKLEISWHSAHGHYEIRIKDNGQGFRESGNQDEHYGLENMKQRAAEIHADFHVETNPGLGSQIKISK